MKYLINTFFLMLFVLLTTFCAQEKKTENTERKKMIDSITDIVVKDMKGNDVELAKYNGKVLLIVNVASECGYTPQYKGLQEIYAQYKDQGLEILAFPCNDFGEQEPGTNEEIKEFCSVNYGVNFTLFDKVKVLGDEKSPLYARLTGNDVTPQEDIKWNFEKFLISKEGKIIKRFYSKTEPTSDELKSAIEEQLKI